MKWKNAIHDYVLFLKLERGLSKNSMESYQRDINKFVSYLESLNISVSPIDVTDDILQQFIYSISKELNPRTQARLISGLRSFFDFLIFEDYRKTNPTDLLEAPKIGRKLPDTISTVEIDLIISQIDLTHPQGERNKYEPR